MDDRALGQRIAYWRKRRGMTQRMLADRLGRSVSWLRKVENGHRSADRLSTLDSICQVLQIDLHVLIGEDPQRGTTVCIDDAEVHRIRSALERYTALDSGSDPLSDAKYLRRQLEHVWTAFEMADYDVVGHVLPGLLGNAQRAYAAFDTEEFAQILAEVYQVTASTLRKLGEYGLAWLAGDRGITVAERLDDPATVAATGFRIANALLSMGRAATAQTMCVALAERLEPELRTEGRRALYGHILLQGAMAAAAKGDRADVRDLLAEAAEIARHVTAGSNHYRLEFGPANVALHQVASLIAMGEGGEAVEAARAISPAALGVLRRERRAALLVDVARGYSQWGKRQEALSALLRAEGLASREVRCRPVAQAAIADLLLRTTGKPSSQLTQLAARAGVRL